MKTAAGGGARSPAGAATPAGQPTRWARSGPDQRDQPGAGGDGGAEQQHNEDGRRLIVLRHCAWRPNGRRSCSGLRPGRRSWQSHGSRSDQGTGVPRHLTRFRRRPERSPRCACVHGSKRHSLYVNAASHRKRRVEAAVSVKKDQPAPDSSPSGNGPASYLPWVSATCRITSRPRSSVLR